MPAGPIEEDDGVGAGGYSLGDLGQMQGHGGGGAAGQDEGRALGLGGTDGAEDVGRAGPLITRRRRPCASAGPSSGNLVLLPDTRFVAKPDFYVADTGIVLACDLIQLGGEVFLKASMAPSA